MLQSPVNIFIFIKTLKDICKKFDLVQTLLYHGIYKNLQIQHIQLLQPHMLQSQVNIYDIRKKYQQKILEQQYCFWKAFISLYI